MIFVSSLAFKATAQAAGLDFVAFTGNADFDAADPRAFPNRADARPGPEQIDFDIRYLFADPIQEQYRTLQALLREADRERPGRPVVLLHDTVFMGIWPVLLGAPGIRPGGVIGIGVNPLTLRSIDTAPFGFGLPPDSSVEGRARNEGLNAMVENELFAQAQAHLCGVLTATGAEVRPPFIFDGFVSMPDRFLQLSISDLEYERSDAPAGLRFAGALRAAAPPFVAPSWWENVLDAKKLVVVTQGTIANRDFDELIVPTLRALEGMDVVVVAVTGRSDANLGAIPSNAYVADFIPFDHLLPHADVLVSNGGYGGVQQALVHGVPLVLAGESEDKIEVTARTAYTGAAINLATGKPSIEALRSAVNRVLHESAFLLHARRLQAKYRTLDVFAEVSAAVEELARDAS
ncbi:glycosyltransferase [Paraburkholderia caffeinilytica]|uniref:glycosyltransferase n=1 Tax=Paraburkholderia caffeinilytica TaxID=1761016 RepID=UPI0038B6ED8C